MRVRSWVFAVIVLLATAFAAPAGAEPPPLAGPPLQVPADELAQSLACAGNLAGGERDPVLLVPGTGLTPVENYSWNYQPAFEADGRPYCTVTPPNHLLSDIQVSAEYVVSAVRTMHREAGRPVDVVGFSQGGMIGRWGLRFWPDTRAMVDDLIGLAPSNHGTIDANVLCLLGCAPAVHQQRSNSQFIRALNAGGETFPGISYTQIYTRFDEVVVPNFGPDGSSSLRTGDGAITNVAVQEVCGPLYLADHLTLGSSDPVGYRLVLDALDHAGPAEPGRIDGSVCAELFMPGVDPISFPSDFADLAATAVTEVATYPRTFREPPLAPYAR